MNSPYDCPSHIDYCFWSDAMCERLKDEPSYFSQEEAHIILAMINGEDVPDPLKLQDDFERLVHQYKDLQEEWDFEEYA